MFVPFPLQVRRELRSMTGGWVGRNQERKKNRNRRKELTGTAYRQSHYDVSMPIPSAMGVDIILRPYSVLLPAASTLTVLAQ